MPTHSRREKSGRPAPLSESRIAELQAAVRRAQARHAQPPAPTVDDEPYCHVDWELSEDIRDARLAGLLGLPLDCSPHELSRAVEAQWQLLKQQDGEHAE